MRNKNFYIILDTLKFYTYSNALIFKSFWIILRLQLKFWISICNKYRGSLTNQIRILSISEQYILRPRCYFIYLFIFDKTNSTSFKNWSTYYIKKKYKYLINIRSNKFLKKIFYFFFFLISLKMTKMKLNSSSLSFSLFVCKVLNSRVETRAPAAGQIFPPPFLTELDAQFPCNAIRPPPPPLYHEYAHFFRGRMFRHATAHPLHTRIHGYIPFANTKSR